MRRALLASLVAATCAASNAVAQESEREARLRPLAVASRADTIGLLVGRMRVEKHWNELLDELMYAVAPRGAWNETHTAWPSARKALAAALRRASVARLESSAGSSVHNVIVDHYLDILNDEERAHATAFFGSPGGRVWLDAREAYATERSYGLPFVHETGSHADAQRRAAAAKKALLHLPVEQTNAVYEWNESEIGKRLLAAQNGPVSDIVGNILRSELDGAALDEKDALVREVRARVAGLPPPSEKTYLGTVTMREDRALDVTIEQFDLFRRAGTYPLHYAPDALHWADVAAGVPGMAPGETRNLYRDPRGRLSDRP